ncbi:helix-turn-helix domain-containing protein [Streptomyces rubellomurinus]|uniref:helix-turn-helix domain-containing protein n=1 Tax=Streptomyces rubellomurinus (strain ATCC 31215) TaxID=359131 RepID=UPI000695EA4A|nr:helix-turn-helix transcriptional regulator [Streptomyces rubellomurinus]
MRRRQPPAPLPVPFSPAAARSHRTGLGLTPEQVADGLAAHGVRLLPAHVRAWESGELHPDETELVALARVLWCTAAQLMGTRPVGLRDHRLARELTQQAAAGRIGVALPVYREAERTGRWEGDAAATRALAETLGLAPAALVEATGRRDALDRLLRRCVDGRWQAHLAAVARIVPADRDDLAAALATLHQEHAVPGHWGAPGVRPVAGRLTDRFLELLATSRPPDHRNPA